MTLVSDALFRVVREIGLGLVDLKNLGRNHCPIEGPLWWAYLAPVYNSYGIQEHWGEEASIWQQWQLQDEPASRR